MISLSLETLAFLAKKVSEGTATPEEELLYYQAYETGLDELITLVDQVPDASEPLSVNTNASTHSEQAE